MEQNAPLLKTFKSRNKLLLSNKKATQFGNRILELIQKKGSVQPQDIVDDARDPTTCWHSFFQWDDTLAAQAYRLWQSRALIGSIVEVTVVDNREVPRRSFYSVTNEQTHEPCYVTLEVVGQNTSYRNELLQKLQHQLDDASLTIRLLLSLKND